MRTPSISTVQYTPAPVPNDAAEMRRFLLDELNRIATAIAALAAGHIDPIHVAPAKPRDGDIRYADGTDWDPGSGKGIYAFNGTAWVLIKAL